MPSNLIARNAGTNDPTTTTVIDQLVQVVLPIRPMTGYLLKHAQVALAVEGQLGSSQARFHAAILLMVGEENPYLVTAAPTVGEVTGFDEQNFRPERVIHWGKWGHRLTASVGIGHPLAWEGAWAPLDILVPQLTMMGNAVPTLHTMSFEYRATVVYQQVRLTSHDYVALMLQYGFDRDQLKVVSA